MLDVGQQQFLVLLFVRDAQLDQRREVGIAQQLAHRLRDGGPPVEHFVDTRARQHAARKTPDPLAFGLVIGIEQERPALVMQLVAGHVVAQ